MLNISYYASFVPLIFCLTSIIYYALAIYSTLDFIKQPNSIDPNFHPPVSILKPLRGLDQNAYSNLASFCIQDYPIYQIIFGVQDSNDSSIPVVQQLIRDFPDVDIELVISDRVIGQNLKISNLANAATIAKHSILLNSDSDICVTPDYLMTVVQPFRSASVGVVTCLYRCQAQNWISILQSLSSSTDNHATILVSRKLEGMTFGIGATILIRKTVLDAIGGYHAIADYLQDDFVLGNLPIKAGYRAILSNYVVDHDMATKTISDFFKQSIRWNIGIRSAHPWGYVGQIFTFGIVASLVFLLTTHASSFAWVVLGIVWLLRLMLGWIIGVNALDDALVRRYLWLVPLSDILRFVAWVVGLWGNTVEWRGRRLKVTQDGKIINLSSNLQKAAEYLRS